MSVKITTNQNTVTVADADKSITIINNREPNRLEVVQPESSVIYVATPGPQGPQGPAGTGGGGSSDLTALNSFSASMLTFTGSIQTQVNNLTAATSSYVLNSATSSMIVSGALTASFYKETDPIFTAASRSFVTTSSFNAFTASYNTGSFSGSLNGTSSWAVNALTASYVSTLYSSNFTASFGASTTWTVNHNLNTRYVIVQTFDSNHNQMLPKEITLTNTNTATATFSQAESGYAVVTVGGALLNNITPGGSSGQVQYNNGGAFGGDSKFTFDGTYVELYDGSGTYKALSTGTSQFYTYTDQLNYRLLGTTYVTDFASNERFAGDLLAGTVSATTYDLTYLQTDDIWRAVDQTDSTKATRMLGIYDGTNIFTEGYVVVGQNGVASNVPLIAGTLTPGAPVYISGSATSAPFLGTTVPTSGVVRILGHLIRNEGSGYWFMKFRPDHTWVTI